MRGWNSNAFSNPLSGNLSGDFHGDDVVHWKVIGVVAVVADI
jgi:hypothetical protein